jgi:glucosamine--fructose-6-phosphate aminotransferase (isomerizing)
VNRPTPFEADIAEQPVALRRLADSGIPDLTALTAREWDRVVLTGMGSSHFAGIPTWRALTALGRPAWAVDAGQLLETPGLITDRTLLIITSQSGGSGEAVELISRCSSGALPAGLVVGITDDAESPLATGADVFLPLQSGPEATVSTKSYLNTLAVHRRIIGAFAGEPADAAQLDIRATADTVETLLNAVDLAAIARRTATHERRRLAYIGWGDEGATALFAGLITKESSKVPAEGFVGGQFRHGPFELAGDGMTAVLFGALRGSDHEGLHRIGSDLLGTGAAVVLVGAGDLPGATAVAAPARTTLEALAAGAVVAQLFAVDLARSNGYTPGAFLYGSKITTAL